MKRFMIIPIFVPHLGCPFDCVFCNQKKISGHQEKMNETLVKTQIESYLSSAENIEHIEIAFFGGSFTGIDLKLQKEYLDIAQYYVDQYHLQGIRLSTRPDMISKDILNHLSAYSITVIELGVQSMNQEVLDATKRGHSIEDVYNASKLIRSYGFKLGHQMMLGLPNDTIEYSLNTANQIIAIEPDIVRIYPTLVIKETELAQLYNNGLYKPFSLEETINLCVELVERFEIAGIEVIRIGLQTTETIQEGKDIIAGPYHAAIRQLIDEKRLLNYVLNYLDTHHDKTSDSEIIIEASSKIYPMLIGHKKNSLKVISGYAPNIKLQQNRSLHPKCIKINEDYLINLPSF